MKQLWKNYKSTILLLLGVLVGGLLGVIWPACVVVLKPIGEIFMNLLFVLIVPMVFFSVSSSICNLSNRSALGKTLVTTFATMLVLMVLMALLTYLIMLVYPCVDSGALQGVVVEQVAKPSIGELIVGALTVTDFAMLFSVKHILPLMVIAVLFGWGISRVGNQKVLHAITVCNNIVMEMMDCLMIVAPIGLGCYFANMMAESAGLLLSGFGKLLILYLAMTVLLYGVVYPLLMALSSNKKDEGLSGKKWMVSYWKSMAKPSLMSLSTLSSSACIPANIQAAKEMGADPMLAESIVPIGTQVYKQGSVVSCVTKVIFVLLLSGQAINTPSAALAAIGIAILASMVVGAVPTGAGTGELFIVSILGADPQMVGLLIVISTLVDMPATLLNATGNTILPSVVERAYGIFGRHESR